MNALTTRNKYEQTEITRKVQNSRNSQVVLDVRYPLTKSVFSFLSLNSICTCAIGWVNAILKSKGFLTLKTST